jgi:hypothetical protein
MNEMEMHKKFQPGKYYFGHITADWKIASYRNKTYKVWTKLNRLRTVSCVIIW